jgi:hypothetical protein
MGRRPTAQVSVWGLVRAPRAPLTGEPYEGLGFPCPSPRGLLVGIGVGVVGMRPLGAAHFLLGSPGGFSIGAEMRRSLLYRLRTHFSATRFAYARSCNQLRLKPHLHSQVMDSLGVHHFSHS